MKIELHKQFRVPIDGLMPIAEEITIQKEKKLKEKNDGPYQKVSESEESAESDGDVDKPAGAPKDKKTLKKDVKDQQREKRKLKKELKLAF
jgi:hypothetical protein